MSSPAGEVVVPAYQKPVLHRIETNASLLTSVAQSKQVVVSFSKISAHVPVMVTPGAGSASAAGAAAPDGPQKPKPKSGALSGCLPLTNRDTDEPQAPKERQVLFDIEGTVEPGQILALMGPSGSGKSSLLSVLGGRTTARVTGSMLFNNQPLNKPMKRNMGFVTQDDLLYAELTTFETLYYAALLRLPRHWTKAEKLERVEMVLDGLGLSKCRDTIIGNHMMRGVSGGERKRVSIGHELLINPSVIFLDEPTSGLDSTTALKLVHTLRSLASGGRTIIASIHQPSSRLYQEIDQLMLLSEGRVMYYGESVHATAKWFDMQGVPIPFGVSIPDHLLDLACGDLPGRAMHDSRATQERLLTAFEQRTIGTGPTGVQMSDLVGSGKSMPTPAAVKVSASEQATLADQSSGSTTPDEEPGTAGTGPQHVELVVTQTGLVAPVVEGRPAGNALLPMQSTMSIGRGRSANGQASSAAPAEGKWGATWVQQVRILTSRCVRTRRFQALSIQRFSEVLIVAVLAGLFWFQVGGSGTLTTRNISDISGLLFFQCLFMSFSSMFQALFAFPADFQMLIKERQSGMYRLTAYYVARSISDIPMDCLVPTLFCWIIYWMAGLRISAGAFFCNWFAMLLTMLVAQSLGLLIGATIMNPKNALAAATIFMLTIMLVGGYYVQNIPIWIRWCRYASFIYYGYNLLLKIEFAGRGYNCADYYLANPDAPPGMTWCPIDGSGAVPIDVDTPVTLEVCVLFGMLIVLRTAVYLSLRQKTTFKTKAIKEA